MRLLFPEGHLLTSQFQNSDLSRAFKRLIRKGDQSWRQEFRSTKEKGPGFGWATLWKKMNENNLELNASSKSQGLSRSKWSRIMSTPTFLPQAKRNHPPWNNLYFSHTVPIYKITTRYTRKEINIIKQRNQIIQLSKTLK